jgi:excisionase family DNA binding protein
VDHEILTIQSLSDYLQIDEKTAYRMAQAGELPGFKVRRQWRFKRVDIDGWIEARKRSIGALSDDSAATRARTRRRPTGPSQRTLLAGNRGR